MLKYKRSKVPSKGVVDGRAVHPMIRWIWAEINRQKCSQEDVAQRSGVSASAMRKWRRGDRSPKLNDIEAVVNALGSRIRIAAE